MLKTGLSAIEVVYIIFKHAVEQDNIW